MLFRSDGLSIHFLHVNGVVHVPIVLLDFVGVVSIDCIVLTLIAHILHQHIPRWSVSIFIKGPLRVKSLHCFGALPQHVALGENLRQIGSTI